MLRSFARLRVGQQVRTFAGSAVRRDVNNKIEELIAPREVIERKRKEMEAKYAEKLKKKVEAEGLSNLDALKEKVVAPSVLAKRKAQQYRKEEAERAEKARLEAEEAAKNAEKVKVDAKEQKKTAARQESGDRSGVKPLASIINLPLIHMTPHDADAIAAIWNTYHTTHKTLSGSFLSATLPASTYDSMLTIAKKSPFFVLPLPRTGEDGKEAFEMFYLQWLFHAPPPPPPGVDGPLPPVSSVIFTPLEEFKQAGEWAQPYLTLTHYPDLSKSHDTVLMRGEIMAASAGGPPGASDNPGYMLSQQQAQLLVLGLQRFYCADIIPPHETAEAAKERRDRKQALTDFVEKPQEWDWANLIKMAFGGLA